MAGPTGSVASTVRQACASVGHDRTRMMDVLRRVQKDLRCVNREAMKLIASELGTYQVVVEGLATFYAFFSTEPQGEIVIRLCDDIVDRQAGLESVTEAFTEALGVAVGETSADGRFTLEYTPCIGMCDQAPAAMINDTIVTRLDAQRARAIAAELKSHMEPSRLVTEPGDGNNGSEHLRAEVHNNIRRRGPVLLGEVPDNAGLEQALTLAPAAVIDIIRQSGLRGCGGAGFPIGRKWALMIQGEAERRYIICNADEGEPGTFKDRVLLTERPDLLIEGMTIGAYAMGCREGIIYLRAEYQYLESWLEHCLAQRRERGWLGAAIGGKTGFDFDIRIQLGAGAYICGEEGALISSCEGQRGEPKTRPPFPVQRGYLGYPTCVNNVETLCCAARIVGEGAQWFAAMGTAQSKGTKLLSVSGDCTRPGVYEVPFGLKVSELLEMAGGEEPGAVLMGGPSGEMISQRDIGRTICYEDMPTGGAVVVFNTRRNVLAIVDYYMQFFVEESCGYCTPCRVGNVFLKKRIEKVMKGLAAPDDLDYLENLGHTIINTSRCGLGQTSPNPVLSTIRNFPLVYAALLKERREGMQAAFDIQGALEESRHIAKRRSMIYDPGYEEG